MLSFVASIPRAVLGTTRVNPDACRICAGTGKFDLNTDKYGNGNVFFADFKNIMCYLFRSNETTSRPQDQGFLLSCFNCRVMKVIKRMI